VKYTIRKSEDIDETREMHQLAFPDDVWVGDDHEYWFAYDEDGATCGFASAICYAESNTVYLSRCAVSMAANGKGLQRRFIAVRLRWARSISADVAFTYTKLKNYPSMINLIRAGFKLFDTNDKLTGWREYHCFVKDLRKRSTAEMFRKLSEKLAEEFNDKP